MSATDEGVHPDCEANAKRLILRCGYASAALALVPIPGSGSGAGGTIRVEANSLTVDGQNAGFANMLSSTFDSGNAGSVELVVNDRVKIVNGGFVASATNGSGAGGTIRVEANSLTVDGQDAGYAIILRKERIFYGMN